MSPKETAPIAEPVAAPDQMSNAVLMLAQILSEMKAKSGGDDSKLGVLADGIQALVDQEKHRPKENLHNYPAASSMNPFGDRDKPRPELKCKMFWVGYKLTKEALTRQEIDLLNRMGPGEYRVTKSNGRQIPFTVEGRMDLAGKLEKLSFHFPCKSQEDRSDHMPMLLYLQEALGEKVANVDYLTKQVLSLQAELAARKASDGQG